MCLQSLFLSLTLLPRHQVLPNASVPRRQGLVRNDACLTAVKDRRPVTAVVVAPPATAAVRQCLSQWYWSQTKWDARFATFILSLSLSRSVFRPFSNWTWVSRCLLKQRMMEALVTTGAINRAKLQSNHHHQQTQHPVFYRPDALPVAQPTVSKHWRGKYHIPWTCLPQAHLRFFHLCLWRLGLQRSLQILFRDDACFFPTVCKFSLQYCDTVGSVL